MKRNWMIAGALVIFTLALFIVACGPDPTPAPATALPAATLPPVTESPAPTAEAGATPTRTAATPAALPATAAPTPEAAAEADPGDAYFAMERVLEVVIEIAPGDWDTLRHQTRTFDDLMAEIAKYNLSRPFAGIYTWFPATVTIDGETHTEVGVRKKGFIGSQSETKPSLKLRYDKYVDDQSLGGVMERMTLNNSIQDPSMVNTCLSYQVFAAAGLPSPRCNFATVTVNGKNLGLYVHLEELKKPFLERHFDSAEGNHYEGTISDFTPQYRGTIEKKTNEDEDDWSDVDAVVAALLDPSEAGLEALGEAVDMDRFLSFWATEVLIGHWDGYAGDRNNYHFYREPGGKFVFIPWGADDTFHLEDDPNPFDNISNPPPSVLALSAIPSRLYNIPEGRAKYAERLKSILNTVWDEDELLARVDEMAAIVQEHALPDIRAEAAADTERVRKFILKRKGEILADITPEPPDWPEPEAAGGDVFGGSFTVELSFETTWGSKDAADPFAEGNVTEGLVDGEAVPVGETGVTAGPATAKEAAEIGLENAAYITLMSLNEDLSVSGVTVWLPMEMLTVGGVMNVGEKGVGAISWELPAGADWPEGFTPVTEGALELIEAKAETGAAIVGRLRATFGGAGVAGGAGGGESGSLKVDFQTVWGSNLNPDPFAAGGSIAYLALDEVEQSPAVAAVISGHASPEEAEILPGAENPASITLLAAQPDGSLSGMTLVMHQSRFTPGATLVIGQGGIAGGVVTIPPGSIVPDSFIPFTEGTLELLEAGTKDGAAISGSFSGVFGGARLPPAGQDEGGYAETDAAGVGLVINEVAAKGDPLDWFELYNASDERISLAGFMVADDLADAGKRVSFPASLGIRPGEYLRIELDKDGWPGFALGGDEELGVWTLRGALVDMVDWDEGDSGEGESYARMPDVSGEFLTVGNPTPGAAN